MTQYRQCKKCVLDSLDDAEIEFDAEGVCNHCHTWKKRADEYIKRGAQAERELSKIVEEIKKAGENKKYDSILGVSGGVDSTYTAYYAKKLGLRPLVVHLDNGWNSELSVQNIKNIVQKLDFDLYTHVVRWEEFRDIHLAFLKASVVDVELPTDHAINAILYQMAKREGVRFILSGYNIATEGTLPKSWRWSKLDYKNIKSIHQKFGHVRLQSFPSFGFWQGLYSEFFLKLKVISLLDYVDYDKEKAKELIIRELGWRDYGGKHYESVFTRFYQGYILPKKFHIDKRKAHFSSMICAGQMTKEQAMMELKTSPYPDELFQSDRKFVLKKLGISEDEFEEIMAMPPKSHLDYGSYVSSHYAYHQKLFKVLSPITRMIRIFVKGEHRREY